MVGDCYDCIGLCKSDMVLKKILPIFTGKEDEKDYTPIGVNRRCKGKGYSVIYDVGYFLLCVRFSASMQNI